MIMHTLKNVDSVCNTWGQAFLYWYDKHWVTKLNKLETLWWYVGSVAFPIHSSIRIRKVEPDALNVSGFPLIQSSMHTLNILFNWEMHKDKSLLKMNTNI